MESLNTIQKVVVSIIPVLFAITLHEAAHGWVAKRLGDQTASILGRVTANPFKHIDLIGTILIPVLSYILSGFIFGWAKPVPVDWRKLRNPRRDMALVALAGPAANLTMAIFWTLIIKIGVLLIGVAELPAFFLVYMGGAGVLFNVLLMALNLMPILPLDGGRIMYSLLPAPYASYFARLEPFGLFILVGLLVSGVLGFLIWPLFIITINLLPESNIVNLVFRDLFVS
ncbi:site-2 protease family protein [Sedimenticola hydrogenitrophicus]|uniref:site-2 protease family protein n=1 Tax=Sedimenticola hydrogenitrophicus TaxID=2967975 RepID=UPI0021A8DA50|nr:site-2 protease family protein [Sedimenticola hydrogenitrophicus]